MTSTKIKDAPLQSANERVSFPCAFKEDNRIFHHTFCNYICLSFALLVLIWSFKSVNARHWGKVNLTYLPSPTKKKSRRFRTEGRREQELVPPRPKYRLGNCLFMNVVTSFSTYGDVLSWRKATFGFYTGISAFRAATQI